MNNNTMDFLMTEMKYCLLPTKYGEFRMYDTGDEMVRLISFGDIFCQGNNPLFRMHSSCLSSETFGAVDCDCADQLRESMKMMATEGAGFIIHLHQEGRGQGLSNKIKAISKMQCDNIDTAESFIKMGLQLDTRGYNEVIKILKVLEFTKLRLISNNPRKIIALEEAGIIVEKVNTNPVIRPENAAYLHSKNLKLGHTLPLHEQSKLDAPVHFYHSDQPWGEFSNFSPHPIYLKGLIWQTVEHFYQAQKFADTPIEHKIRLAQSPIKAKQIAKSNCEKYNLKEWEYVKEMVMLQALNAKFNQHPQLKTMLLNTKHRHIAEHTKNDLYWGDGHNKNGKNRLGQLLMQIRIDIFNN